jgi:hypothetical protein
MEVEEETYGIKIEVIIKNFFSYVLSSFLIL